MLAKKACLTALAAIIGCSALIGTAAAATAYPEQPITLVVPFPPGGTSDTLARGIAKGMTDRLGVSVVVENKGGGGTVIGTQRVARAKADGYTLLWAATPIAINPTLYKQLPYDTVKDFYTVAHVAEMPLILAVHPDSKIKTVGELVDLMKKGGQNVTYGSSGMGGSPHLATALFLNKADVKATHVPYRGSSPSVMDLVAGRTTFVFDTLFLMLPQVEAGKLIPLGQTSDARVPRVPNMPTVAEQGFPDFKVTSWFSVMTPAGTPADVIEKLNKTINDVLVDPSFSELYIKQGVKLTGGTAEEAQARLLKEIKTWGEAVKISGATAE
ncbi:MAG TPA: tripartite tricarboxylate transporter substrate binding protein [Candidimonas sp.]|nr:tripartite tricarboxylate transporter substrate binding protein [Candidimonas sp.]